MLLLTILRSFLLIQIFDTDWSHLKNRELWVPYCILFATHCNTQSFSMVPAWESIRSDVTLTRNLYYKDIHEQISFGYLYFSFFILDQYFWGYLPDVLDYLGSIHIMEQSCWSGPEIFNEIKPKNANQKCIEWVRARMVHWSRLDLAQNYPFLPEMMIILSSVQTVLFHICTSPTELLYLLA